MVFQHEAASSVAVLMTLFRRCGATRPSRASLLKSNGTVSRVDPIIDAISAYVSLTSYFLATSGATSIALLLLGNALLNVQCGPGVALVQRMLPRNLGMALGLMNGVAFGAGSAFVIAVGAAVGKVGASNALAWVSALTLVAAATYWLAGRRHHVLNPA